MGRTKRKAMLIAEAFKPFGLTMAFLFVLIGSAGIAAQEVIVDEDTAPPPSRLISSEERSKLNAEPNVKKRTKLALELMDVRLTKAEQLFAAQQFDAMFAELGGFHGLIDNTLTFLQASDRDNRKVIYNFKRFEIGLRSFPPRLGVIRREIPSKYEFYTRHLLRYIRDARAKAVEPLFGESVVPDNEQ